ncbi:MAG: hypothetical protein MNPFHGCM_02700 [Gemmatimonadaceae bacterium]|nr:hypothetical protein [Gemmatimonadaceae bacterium]
MASTFEGESHANGGHEGDVGEPAGTAMDALRRIVRALRTTYPSSRGFQKLSAAQLFVLQQIAAAPGLSLAELCRRTLTSPSSASEVVARLVLGGYVTRATAPGDQRRASFSLTADGVRVVSGAPESVPERLVNGLRTLSPDDQRSLSRLLEAWTSASGLGAVPAAMFLEPLSDDSSGAA